METQNSTFNEMQTLKRRLYAMRNGVIADTLRKAGSPFRIIFGVNLPQLVEIARDTGPNRLLAEQLWANSTTRESMLLAPMLMPADEFTEGEALEWISTVPAVEIADVLCHRLLRHTPYALPLAQRLVLSDDFFTRYTGLRLMCNLSGAHPDLALTIGQNELSRRDPRTQLIAMQLLSAGVC